MCNENDIKHLAAIYKFTTNFGGYYNTRTQQVNDS